MKKIFVLACMAGAALAMQSCRTAQQVVTLSVLEGEWNIVEVNGAKVEPGEEGILPFMNFDTVKGHVSGSSGCNRIMGGFDLTAKPGIIDLKKMASTQMMCADMTTEMNVINALQQVTSYRKAANERVQLCNSYNRPVIVLERK